MYKLIPTLMFVLGSFALFAQDSLQTKQDTNVVLQAIIPLATDTLSTQPVMGKDSVATLNLSLIHI